MCADAVLPPSANAMPGPGERPFKKVRTSDAGDDLQQMHKVPVEISDGGVHVFETKCNDVPMGKQMVFLELCAGSAVLSAMAQKHGYRVMPVDFKKKSSHAQMQSCFFGPLGRPCMGCPKIYS